MKAVTGFVWVQLQAFPRTKDGRFVLGCEPKLIGHNSALRITCISSGWFLKMYPINYKHVS
jgi:hypothetical protein